MQMAFACFNSYKKTALETIFFLYVTVELNIVLATGNTIRG